MNTVKILSTVYAHYETHGPGIYHNELFAKYSKSLDIIYSNVSETSWQFPDNVTLIPDRDHIIPLNEVYKKSLLNKWFLFLKYTWLVLKNARKNKYDIIVLFNGSSLLAYRIIRRFVPKKTKIWYHNYDPIDCKTTKMFSQQWFALKATEKMFPKIDLFTHSEEKRNVFFPIDTLKNPFKILPNYPTVEQHSGVVRTLNPDDAIKLIFSGVISPGNGLEELIKLTKDTIDGRGICLIIKGFVQQDYLQSLVDYVAELKLEDQVTFIAAGPWKEVPEILRTAHIGIHIFNKADHISRTLGKGGSGKVFQYIAEGLPVLMSKGFKNNFMEYDWAVATDLDGDSLHKNVKHIIDNYDSLTTKAIQSFKTELSCNKAFHDIFTSLISN